MTKHADWESQVDESQRRRFEAAWIRGDRPSLESFLPPADEPGFLPTLAELVQIDMEFAWKAWKTRRDAGAASVARRPDAVEQYLERFPQLRRHDLLSPLLQQECLLRRGHDEALDWNELQLRFARLGMGDEAFATVWAAIGPREVAVNDTLPIKDDWPALGRFENYEVLEEIGRGGMGVVFRALQKSPPRTVALKVMRPEVLPSLSRWSQDEGWQRFRREAQAAARLEHEHIVTIYEVGDSGGAHFFSMRYVEGKSLAEMLRGGPLENLPAARYVEQAARAVDEAHRHGVLHRDLKPGNILVDARTDRALVADFGLAKLLEGAEELTREGDVVGTPPYMPPEQARDSAAVVPQSDIYALGATLYHLLTGRPPFQAATPLQTLRQVLDQEPVPPSQLNRAIARDLETICLKCLNKEPAQRYATGAELADDLARYAAGEPVRARRIGPAGRAARWCRRNPGLALASALAALFLLAALAATSIGYATASAALGEKSAALYQKERALHEAESSYRRSREVVNQFFTVVSDDILLDQPGMQPLRNRLLQLAMDSYQQFLAERGEDPALLDEIGRTHYRVGLITESLEPGSGKALEEFARARRIQRRLLAEGDEDSYDALGDTLNALGRVHVARGELQAASADLGEAKSIRTALADNRPEHRDYQRKLANTIMNLGLVQARLRQSSEALESLEAAQSRRRMLLDGRDIERADQQQLLVWRDVAMGHFNRAQLARTMKQAAEFEREMAEALSIFETLVRIESRDLNSRSRLASGHHLAGAVLLQAGDFNGAARHFTAAIQVLEDLTRHNPRVLEFREQLAAVYLDEGALQFDRREYAEAARTLALARDMLRPLAPPPDSTEQSLLRRNYAVALRELARAQLALEQPDKAAKNLESARQFFQILKQQAGSEPSAQQDLEATLRLLQRVNRAL